MSLSVAAPPMSLVQRYWRDRALWTTIADVFAILAALALPWSTTLVAIFVPCWLGAVAWVMDWRAYGRLLKKPICYFPLALVGLALVGTLWSDAAWGARLYAIGPTLKLLVQWGMTGVLLLYAMWLVHLLLFCGEGFVAWLGILVVVQNIFTSLFNSHLFDFHEGWMYVLGVGVAGGMTLAAKQRRLPAAPVIPR